MLKKLKYLLSVFICTVFWISPVSAYTNLQIPLGGSNSASTPSLAQVTAVGASTSDTLSLQNFTYANATGTSVVTTGYTSSSRYFLSNPGSASVPGILWANGSGFYGFGAGTMAALTNQFVVRNTADTITVANLNTSLASFGVPLTMSTGNIITANGGVTSTSLQVNGPTTSTGKFYLTNPGAAVSGDQALCQSSTSSEVHINTGAATCTVSSARFKHDIVSIDDGLEAVLKLNPVNYKRNSDGVEEHGLIAEEVAKIDPESVFYEKDGTPRGVKYENLTAVLIKAIQEQQKEINELKANQSIFTRFMQFIKNLK